MSFLKKEINRVAKLHELWERDEAVKRDDPEVQDYMAALQRCLVCWEPWTVFQWSDKQLGELLMTMDAVEYQVWEMTNAACLHNQERYVELYLKYRDHSEFTFEEFVRETLRMAYQEDFVWQGPMTNLPPTPGQIEGGDRS